MGELSDDPFTAPTRVRGDAAAREVLPSAGGDPARKAPGPL